MKPYPPFHKQQLGKFGESLAASYLQKQGYRIIERNFRGRYGELDIIAIKDKILVFVEVKTRIGRQFGLPEEAVTARKLGEVVKTAEFYKISHHNLPDALRIDVIAIELDNSMRQIAFRHLMSVT